MKKENIYNYSDFNFKPEIFEILAEGNGNFKIEKIVSNSYSNGEWYDQSEDELVFLLDGNASIEFASSKIVELQKGDFIKIEKHLRHRVVKTSESPKCVWLTFFAENITSTEDKI
ncbi:MAG: cupin domain-containing protein [Opitutales bacterium]|nr:cupin domain-containing protein [Opitutales bacterium]